MEHLPPYVTPREQGALVAVFVQPRAAKQALAGTHGDALKLKVTAPPVDDRANRATEAFLARVLGLPPSSVAVVAGRSSRYKRVAVTGRTAKEVALAVGRVLSCGAHESGPQTLVAQGDGEEDYE